MELTDALDFARGHRNGVLATVKRDGRPQLSTVSYYVDDEAALRISITADRAKTANMRRDPRVSLFVTAADFYSYAVLEAEAELMPPATDPHDPTADALVTYYRTMRGDHPDWDEYRAAMVEDRRLVLTLRPTRAYGMDLRTGTSPATTD
jgi:PPOX class probable F420-dependent enzyme